MYVYIASHFSMAVTGLLKSPQFKYIHTLILHHSPVFLIFFPIFVSMYLPSVVGVPCTVFLQYGHRSGSCNSRVCSTIIPAYSSYLSRQPYQRFRESLLVGWHPLRAVAKSKPQWVKPGQTDCTSLLSA